MTDNRVVLYLDETMTDSHGDYSPVLVTENEPGYTPTTYSFGPDFDLAQRLVAESNAARGYSHGDALLIVASSFAATDRTTGAWA